MPTPEEVQCNLPGKSIFTIFYEKDSYWLVKLDDAPQISGNSTHPEVATELGQPARCFNRKTVRPTEISKG